MRGSYCVHALFSFYQACGISLSVGLLLHGLVLCGHGGVIQMAQQRGHDWRNVLENKVNLSPVLNPLSCHATPGREGPGTIVSACSSVSQFPS